MNFFGLGPIELLIIVIVALLVVGPEKLPELGAVIGRFIIDFRRVSDEVKSAFSDAVVEPRPTWNGTSTSTPAASQAYVSPSQAVTTEADDEPEARPLAESESESDSTLDDENPASSSDRPTEPR